MTNIPQKYCNFARNIVSTLLPDYCIGCGERLQLTERNLCKACQDKLPRTNLWLKPRDNKLAKSYWKRTGNVDTEKVAAFLTYANGTLVGEIVHRFKYHGERKLAQDMGQLMARELKADGFFEDIDCLLPIPLTRWRKLRRGYNQAEHLARGISKETGLKILSNVIRRNSFKTSQTKTSGIERTKNVEGVFSLMMKCPEDLRGKHILIVDDVITTGATTRSCVKQLAPIPDVKVSILGFSTVQSGDIRVVIKNNNKLNK